MLLSAVVFDFDGVIADSEPLHFEGFRRVLARQGVALGRSDYYEKYLGYDDAGAFRAALADHGQRFDDGRIAGLVADKLALFPDMVAGQPVIYEGAAACIARLGAEVPLAIASGAALNDIEVVLRGTGLRERFRTVVAAEHTPRSKPHPDPYRRAVDILREQGVAGDGHAAAPRRRHRGFGVGPAVGARRRAADGGGDDVLSAPRISASPISSCRRSTR